MKRISQNWENEFDIEDRELEEKTEIGKRKLKIRYRESKTSSHVSVSSCQKFKIGMENRQPRMEVEREKSGFENLGIR